MQLRGLVITATLC